MKLTIWNRLLAVFAMGFAAIASAPLLAAADARTNVIIFVADGLRGGSVNATDAPTMDSFRQRGVRFTNSHSLYPTLTTANASAIATGHGLGDTRDLANALFTGAPLVLADGKVVPMPVVFIENDVVLRSLDAQFDGNYLTEETLLAHARSHGCLTVAIGKRGPALIQDVTQSNPNATPQGVTIPRTIIIDDATGTPEGVPLDPAIIAEIAGRGLPTQAPNRNNGHPRNSQQANGYSGDNTHAGTLAANVPQQKYFADVLTTVLLPMFATNTKPFVIVFWSRDPDASQHNQGDSLNSLRPGINGPTSKAGIRNCDSNLAQILAALRDLRLDTNTDVLITADHGFDTISRHQVDDSGRVTKSFAASVKYYDANGRQDVNSGYLPPGFLAIDLAHALDMPLFDPDTLTDARDKFALVDPTQSGPGNGKGKVQHPLNGNGLIGGTGRVNPMTDAPVVVAANSGSDLIYLTGGSNPANPLVHRIVEFLAQQDYVSGVFVDDQYGDIPGALKLSDINLIGASRPARYLPTPAIIVNFASFATDPANPTQSGVIVAEGDLQEGQGNHGGFDRSATFNFMAACGPDFKVNYTDYAPVSNADVPMTAARLLGFDITPHGNLTGRVIEESLVGGPAVDLGSIKSGTSRSAMEHGVQTVLNWQEYQGRRYFDAGGFPGRTLGLMP